MHDVSTMRVQVLQHAHSRDAARWWHRGLQGTWGAAAILFNRTTVRSNRCLPHSFPVRPRAGSWGKTPKHDSTFRSGAGVIALATGLARPGWPASGCLNRQFRSRPRERKEEEYSRMFTKSVKTSLEAGLQAIAADLGFAPKIQKRDGSVVHMDAINGRALSDIYTDDAALIPDAVWKEIERMLTVLFETEGIEYIDITSYNFMEDAATGRIWVVDFGDAFYTPMAKGQPPSNWFLRSVLAGESGKAWNPDFA
jgi:hypothetical protein